MRSREQVLHRLGALELQLETVETQLTLTLALGVEFYFSVLFVLFAVVPRGMYVWTVFLQPDFVG